MSRGENNAVERAPFSRETFEDYVLSHGFGEPTRHGLVLGQQLYDAGDDYATIGHEIVARGLTADLEHE
jgi:hypothetical protein